MTRSSSANGRHSSVRKRAYITILVAVVNFFGFATLASIMDERLMWGMIFVPAMAGLYLLSLRCPKCGGRIYKRHAELGGVTVTYWGSLKLVPKSCSHCESSLP